MKAPGTFRKLKCFRLKFEAFFFVVYSELLKDIQLMIFLLKHISNLHEKQHNHNKWRQIFSGND